MTDDCTGPVAAEMRRRLEAALDPTVVQMTLLAIAGGTLGVLFEVAGQAPVAVGHRAESSLNAPAQRQRGEAIGLRFTCGNLKIDFVPVPGGPHRGTHIDPVDLDPDHAAAGAASAGLFSTIGS